MKHQIDLENIRLYAYHGCLNEEALVGSNYRVDITLETDFTLAAQHDDLTQTIDYCIVFEIVKAEMAIRAKLLENVAQRISLKLREKFHHIHFLRVKITKLNSSMNGNVQGVSVIIES